MLRSIYKNTIINKPIEEVFNFFKSAENLNRITPPELNFTILTPIPFDIQKGTKIDYALTILGFKVKWQTLITEFDAPFFFIDDQIKGPYSKWTHHHIFSKIDDLTTQMEDKVFFKVPGGPLEPIIYHLFVKKKLNQIFKYRQEICARIFNT